MQIWLRCMFEEYTLYISIASQMVLVVHNSLRHLQYAQTNICSGRNRRVTASCIAPSQPFSLRHNSTATAFKASC
jgi:hypothetical protein